MWAQLVIRDSLNFLSGQANNSNGHRHNSHQLAMRMSTDDCVAVCMHAGPQHCVWCAKRHEGAVFPGGELLCSTCMHVHVLCPSSWFWVSCHQLWCVPSLACALLIPRAGIAYYIIAAFIHICCCSKTSLLGFLWLEDSAVYVCKLSSWLSWKLEFAWNLLHSTSAVDSSI